MQRVDGALARTFDFGAGPGRTGLAAESPRLRLASSIRLAGAYKYQLLEARRRRAQIKARRLLDLLDSQEIGR